MAVTNRSTFHENGPVSGPALALSESSFSLFRRRPAYGVRCTEPERVRSSGAALSSWSALARASLLAMR